MSLLNKIKEASTEARFKAIQDKTKCGLALVLTTLYAEAARVGKDRGNRNSTDEEVIAVIKKNIAGAEECLKVAQHKEKYEFEIEVLSTLLPKQLTEEELKAKVNELITEDVKNLGLIMKHFKEKYAGLYDGNKLSGIVKQELFNIS